MNFSGECISHLHGSVSEQNLKIRGTERSTEGDQSFTNSLRDMPWYDVEKKVTGPCVFEFENVHGENFRNIIITLPFHYLYF